MSFFENILALGVILFFAVVFFSSIGFLFEIGILLSSCICSFIVYVYQKVTGVDLEKKFFPKRARDLGTGEYELRIWNYLVEKTGSEQLASDWLDEVQEDYPGTVRSAVYNGYGRLVWQDLMAKNLESK